MQPINMLVYVMSFLVILDAHQKWALVMDKLASCWWAPPRHTNCCQYTSCVLMVGSSPRWSWSCVLYCPTCLDVIWCLPLIQYGHQLPSPGSSCKSWRLPLVILVLVESLHLDGWLFESTQFNRRDHTLPAPSQFWRFIVELVNNQYLHANIKTPSWKWLA